MRTIEEKILEFATDQWGEKDLAGIGLKLGEEAGEIAGALVKIPEGRATLKDLDDEVGDLLIVLSQIAAKRGTTLERLREIRFAHIRARAARLSRIRDALKKESAARLSRIRDALKKESAAPPGTALSNRGTSLKSRPRGN